MSEQRYDIAILGGGPGGYVAALYADGVKSGQLSLPSGSGWLFVSKTVALRSGLNVIGVQTDSGDYMSRA